MDSLSYMVRSALRSLRRRPGFSGLVVGTLALGIGANAAIFSVVNGVLLEPLPYPDADRLVAVWTARGTSRSGGVMSYPDLDDLRTQAPAIERLVGFSPTTITLTGRGEPVLLSATRVSDGLLEVFGLAPAMGRDLRVDEFGAEAAAVVVVSHAFWQQRLGGRDEVLGETLVLNGEPYQIVGVAPPGFQYPSRSEIWYPRRIDIEGGCGRGCHTWESIGRLAPGADLESAQAQADGIAANLSQAFPASNLDKGFLIVSLRDEVVGDVRVGLWVLLAAVGAVLLIACANVANLMLARAAERQGEVALRAALGATPRQLAGALLTESTLLALMGGGAGLLLAGGALETVRRLSAGTLPRVETIAIDSTVLLFTLAIALLVALSFGLAPALQHARMPLTASGGVTARGTDLAPGSRRVRSALTAVEMCLSVVLLVAAGLLLRTFFQLYAVDPGFETRDIVRFSLSLPEARYAQLDQLRTTFRTLERNIAALPGVEAVGSVYGAPMDFAGTSGDVVIEGIEPPPPGRENSAALRPVSPGYLETMRIPLIEGRTLGPADDSSERLVAVVNEAFVRDNFPGRDPIGERVRITVDMGFGSPYWTIVGVIGDVRSISLTREPHAEIYVPHGRMGSRYMNVNVRGVAGTADLIDAIRAEVQAIDPDLPLQRVETMREAVKRGVAPTRFLLVGVGVFAAVATLLAAVGLYGVMAYLVSRRTREIGVRVALGASSARVVRMVVADGLRPAAVGLLAGLVLALAGGHVIESLLFGVDARDPLILLAVAAVLTAVTLAAIVTPAARASRVDPLRSLRAD